MPHRVWTAPLLLTSMVTVTSMFSSGTPSFPTVASTLHPPLTTEVFVQPRPSRSGSNRDQTGQFANVGTSEADEDVDAAIIMNGIELHRERFTSSDPVAPSGEGGPLTFSADFVAELGVHEFELVLDVNNNITEQREDNNHESMQFSVVEPYLAELIGPLTHLESLPAPLSKLMWNCWRRVRKRRTG